MNSLCPGHLPAAVVGRTVVQMSGGQLAPFKADGCSRFGLDLSIFLAFPGLKWDIWVKDFVGAYEGVKTPVDGPWSLCHAESTFMELLASGQCHVEMPPVGPGQADEYFQQSAHFAPDAGSPSLLRQDHIEALHLELIGLRIWFDLATFAMSLCVIFRRAVLLFRSSCSRRKKLVVVRGVRHQVRVSSGHMIPLKKVAFFAYLLLVEVNPLPVAAMHDHASPAPKQSNSTQIDGQVTLANHAVWGSIIAQFSEEQSIQLQVIAADGSRHFQVARSFLEDVEWPNALFADRVRRERHHLSVWPVIPQPSPPICQVMLVRSQPTDSDGLAPVLIGHSDAICWVPKACEIGCLQAYLGTLSGQIVAPVGVSPASHVASGHRYLVDRSDDGVSFMQHVGKPGLTLWKGSSSSNTAAFSVKVWFHHHLSFMRYGQMHKFVLVKAGQCLMSVVLREFEDDLEGRHCQVSFVRPGAIPVQGRQAILTTASAYTIQPVLVRLQIDTHSTVGTAIFRQGWDRISVSSLFSRVLPNHECDRSWTCKLQYGDSTWQWDQEFQFVDGEPLLAVVDTRDHSDGSDSTECLTDVSDSVQGSSTQSPRSGDNTATPINSAEQFIRDPIQQGSYDFLGTSYVHRPLNSFDAAYMSLHGGDNTATPQADDSDVVGLMQLSEQQLESIQWARIEQAAQHRQSVHDVANFAVQNYVRRDMLQTWLRGLHVLPSNDEALLLAVWRVHFALPLGACLRQALIARR